MFFFLIFLCGLAPKSQKFVNNSGQNDLKLITKSIKKMHATLVKRELFSKIIDRIRAMLRAPCTMRKAKNQVLEITHDRTSLSIRQLYQGISRNSS